MQRSRKAPPLTPMNNKVLTLIMTSADLYYRFADCSFKDLLIEISIFTFIKSKYQVDGSGLSRLLIISSSKQCCLLLSTPAARSD